NLSADVCEPLFGPSELLTGHRSWLAIWPKGNHSPMTTTVLDVSTDVSTSDAASLSPDTLLFRDLPLSDDVQLAVQMAGYMSPTDVQAQIIPHMLDGRDVLAQSQTGTGKTAAFALPILSR